MDRTYYSNTIDQLLQESPEQILGVMARANDFTLLDTQRDAWLVQTAQLNSGDSIPNWVRMAWGRGALGDEYTVPRTMEPMLERIGNWEDYLSMPPAGTTDEDLRKHSRSGRPAGDAAFIGALEALTGRRLKRLKPGPRPASRTN